MKKLLLCILGISLCGGAIAAGIQEAWDNPDANMAAGSTKPGFAQLTWTPGAVLPIRLRNGMVTMINFPNGEQLENAVIGNDGLFQIDTQKGGNTIYMTPVPSNQGGDTNLIVTGKSGNKYLLYLRSEPSNSGEISYSQVDIILDGRSSLGTGIANNTNAATMNSIFPKTEKSTSLGVDGEDYGWIKTMKINPSEFRFDLDIFVPNPDDYVIAPERVWRDNIFTYIDFGDKVIAMTQRPVVSLLVEGGESPVGFRTDGENGRLLIVEAVGDMVLRSGQRIVCIKRRAKPFLIGNASSVMALAEANVMNSINSAQSLQNVGYGEMPITDYGMPVIPSGYDYGAQVGAPAQASISGTAAGVNMLPATRNTAGAFLPASDIPIITSAQSGVAVELKSDRSVKALNDYWEKLLSKFSGDDGAGLLTPYRNQVFFAVDESGVGELGADGASARLYRLRIGPMTDIDTAQKLCDKLTKFQGTSCSVVRVQ
ncbi:MAG: TrbG/VirB9 family P-type conjugative transfer protein [Rickettsiales bacterium]|jgi:ComB9 competence protein|nr:TrbG/VirB9 family P-type conjugative transfer protein [Rickettsiales bacterium]